VTVTDVTNGRHWVNLSTKGFIAVLDLFGKGNELVEMKLRLRAPKAFIAEKPVSGNDTNGFETWAVMGNSMD
jgi:hypothetical protein